jgi:hypothetical protein
MVISKVGVLSCGKVMGALYALIGLIVGACLALFSLIGAGFAAGAGGDDGAAAGMFGAMFGVGAVIMLPLFYGFAGFIGGLITAAIYNLVSGAVGGLELDVQ